MSGHSKWANIKNRKGAQDKKRSEVFTKMAKNIMTAIRTAGGNSNPDTNLSLKTAIEKAKTVNMPKENIDRLLKRFEERKANLVSGQMEGFGPFGVPVIIEIETDNKNRTLAEIKLIFRDNDGNLGDNGSVAFMFDRIGEVETKAIGEDQQLDLIDAGAIDFEDNLIFTEPSSLKRVVDRAMELGMEIESSGLIMKCRQPVILESDDQVARIMELVEQLEDNEDVVNVFTGFDYHG